MKFGRLFYRFKKYAKIYWLLFKDPKTPKISKIMVLAALVYLIWPFDLIPDIIPFAGLIDEIIIIPLLFYIATKFIPKSVVEDNKRKVSGKKKDYEEVLEGEIVD